VRPRLTERYHLQGLLKLVQVSLGILMLWLVFYLIGQALLVIPGAFHEGTMWRDLF
jgi:cell division protein FtsL